MKYKYNISYIYNDEIIPLKFNGKNLFDSDLKTIDNSCIILESEEELLYYLKGIYNIPKSVNKLYITHTEIVNNMEVEKIIYDGDILLFKSDKDKYNASYIGKLFNYFKLRKSTYLLEQLFKLYYRKYNLPEYKLKQKKYVHFLNMLNRVKQILLLIEKRKDNIYETNPKLEQKLQKALEEFYNKEYFSYTKNGKSLRYANLRDLIIKVKYVNGEYDINRKHTYLDYNNLNNDLYFEEFLTEEDFDRSIKEILKTYNNEFKPYQDGVDFIAPITKEEISNIDDMGYSLNLKRR